MAKSCRDAPVPGKHAEWEFDPLPVSLGKPQEPHGQSRALRDTPHPQPAAAHGVTAHKSLAASIWPMARAQSSPLSKARALQGAGQAVTWKCGTAGTVGRAWAHQGLQVSKSRDCSMQLPVGSAAEGSPGVALCDTGPLVMRDSVVSRALCDIREPHPG